MHGKFNCPTVNFDRTQHGIYVMELEVDRTSSMLKPVLQLMVDKGQGLWLDFIHNYSWEYMFHSSSKMLFPMKNKCRQLHIY